MLRVLLLQGSCIGRILGSQWNNIHCYKVKRARSTLKYSLSIGSSTISRMIPHDHSWSFMAYVSEKTCFICYTNIKYSFSFSSNSPSFLFCLRWSYTFKENKKINCVWLHSWRKNELRRFYLIWLLWQHTSLGSVL